MLLTNLTIARFQRKIRKFRLARSQSVTYVFRYVLLKKKKKTYYQLLRKIWWLPHPRPPTRALYAKLQREKLQFLSLLTTILKALICWKLESFRGLRPLGPRQGLCPCTPPGALWRAPGPHPYEAPGAQGAEPPEGRGFGSHQIFRRPHWRTGGGDLGGACPPPNKLNHGYFQFHTSDLPVDVQNIKRK